ncbi:hypothetical protein [Candidatus Viadribacter manganicus]|uniref:PH domain-containing protein n=1 Tax=Candidatus Viadribacter manganicus TaxID=1759059 RepID=A0A1B1AFQ8_9PROT|nr:hypothetical protein [Candidatus Viadribacter manganicus]ANP45365.1 hypothetical protein ATE48_05275 [Candidatus Viadribacter manganicus]
MQAPLVIRPKRWLLFAAVAAVVLAPLALTLTPNPFEGLAPGQAPPRFFIFLWVALPLMTALAGWRLLTWTTYQATAQSLEARNLFGAQRLAWADLASAALDAPIGMPPAYELRFGKRKIRFIAAHHDRAAIERLKVLVPQTYQPLPPSAKNAA